jgi:hypothetical protein
MIRMFILACCVALASCTTTDERTEASAGELTLVLPDELAAQLRQGKPLRFGPPAGPLPATADAEHCGQICHTYRVCDSSGCHSEKICVDNPRCDGHRP